jgi:hypothetical protein
MPASKGFATAYYLLDSSLLALIHNIALSNGYCVSHFQFESHKSATTPRRAVAQSALPGFFSSVTIVTKSVILLLAPILSFISVHVRKVFTSYHDNKGA